MRAVNGGGPERTAWNSIYVRRVGALWFGASVAGATCLFLHGCSFDAAPISSSPAKVRGDAIGETMASATGSQTTTKKKPKADASPRDAVGDIMEVAAEAMEEESEPPAAEGDSDAEEAPGKPPRQQASAGDDDAPPPEPAVTPNPGPEAMGAMMNMMPVAGAMAVTPPVAGAMAAPAAGAMASAPVAPAPAAPPPEGRCDLPSCVPQEIRACLGRGQCRRDLNDSTRCFDNGMQVELVRSPFGDIVTVRREDNSTCFSVAMGTDPETGEVGAAYRNAEGMTVAVAGLSGGFWGFRCNSGTGKVFDMRACGMFGDLPPGVGATALCAPDASCGKP